MNFSVSDIKLLIALLAAAGSSLATLLFGFGSIPYYAFVLAALIIGFPLIGYLRKHEFSFFAASSGLILMMSMLHAAYPKANDIEPFMELFRGAVMTATILFAVYAASLEEHRFTFLMRTIAVTHVIYFSAAIIFARAELEEQARFSVGSVAVASTAEIALGLGFAGLLSKSRFISLLSILIAFAIIFLTQMRITGLSLFLAILMYFLLSAAQSRLTMMRGFTILVSIGLVAVLVTLFLDWIWANISSILLLEDAHRGIASGFSGRFDNIADAVSLVLDRPLAGHGFQNDVVNYAHNGYILFSGQLGIPTGLLFVFFVMYSIWLGAKRAAHMCVAVAVGYALFLLGQPRNINLQLGVLVGLICVIRILLVSHTLNRALDRKVN